MFKYSLIALAALLSPVAVNAATVTLDSTIGGNAGMIGKAGADYTLQGHDAPASSFVYLDLAAGTYDVTAVSGGWNRWGSTVANCAAGGANCTQGYEWSFAYFLPDTAASTAEWTGVNYSAPYLANFFASADQALSSIAGAPVATLNLLSAQRVAFFIYDDYLRDNNGSVTFSVTPQVAPVPLPASGLLLAAGLAGVAALRRRKSA